MITCYKSWERPVDPAADEDHGQHIGDITFHHVCQHAGICENTQQIIYNTTSYIAAPFGCITPVKG